MIDRQTDRWMYELQNATGTCSLIIPHMFSFEQDDLSLRFCELGGLTL